MSSGDQIAVDAADFAGVGQPWTVVVESQEGSTNLPLEVVVTDDQGNEVAAKTVRYQADPGRYEASVVLDRPGVYGYRVSCLNLSSGISPVSEIVLCAKSDEHDEDRDG